MKRKVITLFFISFVQTTFAQSSFIPERVVFADLILKINAQAQVIIQHKVDSIKKNEAKVQSIRERIKAYAPLASAIFRKKNIHPDFQYVMSMRSQVEGNFKDGDAIGFWALTDEKSFEIGLQTQKPDLRKHFVVSTEKMADFFKNNQYYLKNVLFTVLSSEIGLINTSKLINDSLKNKSVQNINAKSHPYLLDFLAHFLVFKQESIIESKFKLWVYENKPNYSTTQIAEQFNLSIEKILTFNEWIIDIGKPYKNLPILLPMKPEDWLEISRDIKQTEKYAHSFAPKKNTKRNYPIIINQKDIIFHEKNYTLGTINGIRGVIAKNPSSSVELADIGNLTLSKFLRINDISGLDNIQSGVAYYFEPKKNTTSVHTHILKPEETFWAVAQKYGLKLNTLLKYNQVKSGQIPKVGEILYLNASAQQQESLSVSTNPPNIITPSTFSQDTLIQHLVKKGETLYRIAQKYNVSMVEIRNWNNLRQDLRLRTGASLKILKTNTAKIIYDKASRKHRNLIEYTSDSLYILHTVGKNETSYDIAQKYNVTKRAILTWNNLQKNSILLQGDKVRIKVRDGKSKKPKPFFRKPIPIKQYVVIKPESITKIAYKLNIPVNRLTHWNPNQPVKSDLMPNTKLNLKGEINVYNAGFGESIETIARHLQIEARQIARWNNKPMTSYAIGIGGEQLLLKPYGEKQVVIPRGYVEKKDIQQKQTRPNQNSHIVHFHILEPAQTLSQVAQKYHISKNQIITYNNLTALDIQNLTTGDTLFLRPAQRSTLTGHQKSKPFISPYDFSGYEVIPADYHIYKNGETLENISQQEAVHVEKIKSWNRVSDDVFFTEGDTLLLTNPVYLKKILMKHPSSHTLAKKKTYVTQRGDNIYTIANKFDLKISDIRTWNNFSADVFELQEGLQLIIGFDK